MCVCVCVCARAHGCKNVPAAEPPTHCVDFVSITRTLLVGAMHQAATHRKSSQENSSRRVHRRTDNALTVETSHGHADGVCELRLGYVANSVGVCVCTNGSWL